LFSIACARFAKRKIRYLFYFVELSHVWPKTTGGGGAAFIQIPAKSFPRSNYLRINMLRKNGIYPSWNECVTQRPPGGVGIPAAISTFLRLAVVGQFQFETS
jgi:hypothetical protein